MSRCAVKITAVLSKASNGSSMALAFCLRQARSNPMPGSLFTCPAVQSIQVALPTVQGGLQTRSHTIVVKPGIEAGPEFVDKVGLPRNRG